LAKTQPTPVTPEQCSLGATRILDSCNS